MAQEEKEMIETPGFGWKVSLSIIVGIGWLVFLILWLFFYASDYTSYQNIAIFFLSLVIIGLILGIPWAYWGMRYRTERDKEMWETKGFKWRVALSTFVAFILAVFLIYWFWYQAEDFGLYQNIAVFIVSILIMGGLMGATWAPWGMKYGKQFEEKK